MDFETLVSRRYSARKYTDRPVEKEKLDKMLEAGNAAPTAKNQQPQRIYVLQKEDDLRKLDSLTPCRFGASTVLLFTFNKDEDWKNPLEEGIRSGIEDVSIVATHIMFMAAELGLDTCWCNYFPYTDTAKAFGIPDNEQMVLFMPVGYAAEDSVPSPNHAKKKPLEDTVRYL